MIQSSVNITDARNSDLQILFFSRFLFGRLSYRYKLFNIAKSRCDAVAGASTPRSATTASTKAGAGK